MIHVSLNTIVFGDLCIFIAATLYRHLNIPHNNQSDNVVVEGDSVSIHDLLFYRNK